MKIFIKFGTSFITITSYGVLRHGIESVCILNPGQSNTPTNKLILVNP